MGFRNYSALPHRLATRLRVLVCGGRDYGHINNAIEKDTKLFKERLNQWDKGMAVLDSLDKNNLVIISGAARGADTIAIVWAEHHNIELLKFPAKWEEYGKYAGFVRNTDMLEEGEPTLVIAFPGGSGTRNMIKQARTCNIKVKEYI